MRRKEMISREQNGENVYWCKGVKGWKNVLRCFWTESRETKTKQITMASVSERKYL